MYATGPRPKPLPTFEGGHELDPDAERELREWAFSRPAEPEPEFLPVANFEPCFAPEGSPWEDPYYAARERYYGFPNYREVE